MVSSVSKGKLRLDHKLNGDNHQEIFIRDFHQKFSSGILIRDSHQEFSSEILIRNSHQGENGVLSN